MTRARVCRATVAAMFTAQTIAWAASPVLASAGRTEQQAVEVRGDSACITAHVDTTGWVTTRNFDLGIEFLRPARYQEKVWAVTGGILAGSRSVEWWRDNSPRWTIEVGPSAVLSDSARRAALAGMQEARECELHGAGGTQGAVQLYRSGRAFVAGRPVVPYVAVVEWPLGEGRVIRMTGFSADSAGNVEQLAIARTLRIARPSYEPGRRNRL